ncbi:hypothetical protein BESB_038140 [Besnoitia besnoiti]|uniref:Uncharacterized protein n=1 Tax=Besnoitia besnoiti TaxID=94643 RepID=A0A2A9MML8_BESBE|nr:hypothetical protein BESB_038140 [Besnoitia besnoiti]PFH37356.1 hypothetical protein BESB_038140 [Besnoitia besnoiti]
MELFLAYKSARALSRPSRVSSADAIRGAGREEGRSNKFRLTRPPQDSPRSDCARTSSSSEGESAQSPAADHCRRRNDKHLAREQETAESEKREDELCFPAVRFVASGKDDHVKKTGAASARVGEADDGNQCSAWPLTRVADADSLLSSPASRCVLEAAACPPGRSERSAPRRSASAASTPSQTVGSRLGLRGGALKAPTVEEASPTAFDWSPARLLSPLCWRSRQGGKGHGAGMAALGDGSRRDLSRHPRLELDKIFLVPQPLKSPLKTPAPKSRCDKPRTRVCKVTSPLTTCLSIEAAAASPAPTLTGAAACAPSEAEGSTAAAPSQGMRSFGAACSPRVASRRAVFPSCLSPSSTSRRIALSDTPNPYFVFNPDLFDDAAVWTAPRLERLRRALGLNPPTERGRRTSSRGELVRCLKAFHRRRESAERTEAGCDVERRSLSEADLRLCEAASQDESNFFLVPVDAVDVPPECVRAVSGTPVEPGEPRKCRSILKTCPSRHVCCGVEGASARVARESRRPQSLCASAGDQRRGKTRKRSSTLAVGKETERLLSSKRIRFSAFNSVQLIDPRSDEPQGKVDAPSPSDSLSRRDFDTPAGLWVTRAERLNACNTERKTNTPNALSSAVPCSNTTKNTPYT